MKLNNTDNKYTIKKKNAFQKKFIIGGILASSLFISLATSNPKNVINSNKTATDIELDSGEEEYNFYQIQYLKALESLDENNFDNRFIDIYDNGKYIINNEEYDIKELYLVQLEDNSIHLIKAGINRTDILTGETFTSQRKKILCLRDTSIFYDIYRSGKINNNEINLDNNILKEYINRWNGEKHYEIPELEADKQAHEAYVKKYGHGR